MGLLGLFKKKPTAEEVFLQAWKLYHTYHDEKSRDMWLKAAKMGNLKAQITFGKEFEFSHKPEEKEAALFCFQEAAKQGNADAARSCAKMYRDGRGAPVNGRKAEEYYMLADQLGDYFSLFDCGELYDKGVVLPLDKEKAFSIYMQAMEKDYRAEQRCGDMCYYGEGVPQNKVRALVFYKDSSEATAAFKAAEMLENGDGMPVDHKEAFQLYERAAIGGLPEAMYICAVAYYEEMRYENALANFKEAAEKGHVEAQVYCGKMYEAGEGTETDVFEALEWYKKAAQKGHVEAMFHTGEILYKGLTGATNRVMAFDWYQKAAEQGHIGATLQLARMYAEGHGTGKDLEKAAELCNEISVGGHTMDEAVKMLGIRLDIVLDIAGRQELVKKWKPDFTVAKEAYEKEDYATAFSIFEQLAHQGFDIAQHNLGIMYYKGKGVASDNAKALEWFEKAAEQGDADAQWDCGVLYNTVSGWFDHEKALEWFERAAEQGHVQAQYNCGVMYGGRNGISRDEDRAIFWLSRVARQEKDRKLKYEAIEILREEYGRSA